MLRNTLARVLLAGILISIASGRSQAHDTWANGMKVPAWVKAACCGPEDAHRLDIGDVTEVKDGWKVDGLAGVVPRERVYPSQDGYVWVFYSPNYPNADHAYCMFIPMAY
jgi:hypothetical protein